MKILLQIVFVCIVMLSGHHAAAQEAIGRVLTLEGDVRVSRSGQPSRALEQLDAIFMGDRIFTGQQSKADIEFNDGTFFTVGQNAELLVNSYVYNPEQPGSNQADFQFKQGTFRFRTGALKTLNPEQMKFSTPVASIGIRGSGGLMEVLPGGATLLALTECCLTFSNRQGKGTAIVLNQPGLFSEIRTADDAPSPPAMLDTLLQNRLLLQLGNKVDKASEEKRQHLRRQIVLQDQQASAEDGGSGHNSIGRAEVNLSVPYDYHIELHRQNSNICVKEIRRPTDGVIEFRHCSGSERSEADSLTDDDWYPRFKEGNTLFTPPANGTGDEPIGGDLPYTPE